MTGFAPDQIDFYLGDPAPVFRRLRAEDPMHWYAQGPFWCATRHADVLEISRRPRTFSSASGTQLFEIRDQLAGRKIETEMAPSIIRMDPPEHNRHRKLAIEAFTPRMVAKLEPRVRELARASVAAIRPGEVFDFIEQVAIPLPMFVIAELLGVPSSDYDDFRRWSDAMIEAGGSGPTPETIAIVTELFAYITAKGAECRRAPREDVLTKLALARVDGQGLNDLELGIFCMTLLVAGNETTRNLISGGMRALLEHPEQWAMLCADPSLIPNAVEEMLRWVTPVRNFVRRVQDDTELCGKKLRAGDFVALCYASANRDEAVFGEDSERFDVTRADARKHVAFGFGEHLCLGASLARLEARVMFEQLVARGPGFALAGEPRPLRSTLMNGIVEMPVVFTGLDAWEPAPPARSFRRPPLPLPGQSPLVRTGLRERQRAATRERLFAAALAEFRSQGFARANVSRIARAARVSRPSFYAHFPTLDHVLYELAWRFSLEIVRRLEAVSGLRETLDELVEGLIEAEAVVGDAALFHEMVSVTARYTVSFELTPEEIPVLGALLRRFEAARDAGELRPGLPPQQAARLCLSGVYGHLLGVDATPAERRADLRALFSLHLADPPLRAR